MTARATVDALEPDSIRTLAGNVSAEELDFAINYDITYRLGRYGVDGEE